MNTILEKSDNDKVNNQRGSIDITYKNKIQQSQSIKLICVGYRLHKARKPLRLSYTPMFFGG